MDESNATCGKRLASIGLENTEANRQAYRTLLVTAPGLGQYISGAILFEETLYQSTTDGKKMVDVLVEQNIVPGIKVDKVIKLLNLDIVMKVHALSCVFVTRILHVLWMMKTTGFGAPCWFQWWVMVPGSWWPGFSHCCLLPTGSSFRQMVYMLL